MAVASTKTLLPLDTFFRLAGVHPLHANQIVINRSNDFDQIAPQRVCGEILTQYSWQTADRISREEVAQSIADAENMIAEQLHYKLLPDWEVDERVVIPQPQAPELYNVRHLDVRGMWLPIQTKWGYVQTGGQRVKSLVSAGSAIVYSDPNSDTWNELATVVVATSVTDPEEIAVYYPGKAGDDAWEIRPIKVVIAAGVATITFGREQCVISDLLTALQVHAINGDDNASFLTTVDVYRKYNSPAQPIQYHWESVGGSACDCGGSTCAICSVSSQDGCMYVRDKRLGLFATVPATWNANTLTFDVGTFSIGRSPDRARIWYKAGWKNESLATPNLTMDEKWARAVTYLALALLDRPLCTCQGLEAFVQHWKLDLAERRSSPQMASSFGYQSRKFDNPLGTTRAAMYAWNLIVQNQIGQGLSGG